MAIGDCYVEIMGTAEETRQPSSGVTEQVSFIVKKELTDKIDLWDGSLSIGIYAGATVTNLAHDGTGQTSMQSYNMSILINNTVYIRKAGTTAKLAIGGVQVDA